MDEHATSQTVDRVVGMRLRQFQRATGLPVVFGGATAAQRSGRRLRIGHVRGTLGTGLVDLGVAAGRGLGGSAIVSGAVQLVHDYASTTAITHDFDEIVVQQERISSIFALPVVVGRTVEAVIYGAVRGPQRIGDVVLDEATSFGLRLRAELAGLLTSAHPRSERPTPLRHTRAAIVELAELARGTTDATRRAMIEQVIVDLGGVVGDDHERPIVAVRPLAPREIDVLRLVAVGMANADVAAALDLTTETVRSYLRNAMRKLGVGNRTAAVHVAQQLDVL